MSTARCPAANPDAGLAVERDRLPKPTLVYPFAAPPEAGTALEVAPGVMWMRMPLPMMLNHINVWAIEDGDGWAIVTPACAPTKRWPPGASCSPAPPTASALSRVFVTHMHPDHVGMAGWLTRKFDARLWMTRLEYLNCRVLTADTGREAPDDGVVFFHRAGWTDAAIENYRARFGNFGKRIHALPDSYRRLSDGEVLRIGAHDWQVIVGTGHSPEHACLYCPELKLLISRRPGAAAHLVQRLGAPDRARRRPDARLDDVAGQAQARGARRRAGAAGAQRVLPRPACAARLPGARRRSARIARLQQIAGRAEARDRRVRRAVRARHRRRRHRC